MCAALGVALHKKKSGLLGKDPGGTAGSAKHLTCTAMRVMLRCSTKIKIRCWEFLTAAKHGCVFVKFPL